MKTKLSRALVCAVVFAIIASTSIAANEIGAMWARLYRNAPTNEQRYQIMVNMIEQDSRDLAPVFHEALDGQITRFQSITGTTERHVANRLAAMTIRELGNRRVTDAADSIWNMLQINHDVVVMSEAANALGRIGAAQYAPRLATFLRNMNLGVSVLSDRRQIEAVAYNTVKALERLGDPAGFEPVFLAAHGWYSAGSGVRAAALDALPIIVDDPTDILTEIIKNQNDIAMKISALNVGTKSRASDENKAEFAAWALDHALSLTWSSRTEQAKLKSLRMTALSALRASAHKPDRAIARMAEMIRGYRADRLYDEDEMLTLIETMGSFPQDSSARALSGFLGYQTERRERDVIPETLTIPRATAIALGNTRNRIGIEQLNAAANSTAWEASVRKEARDAVERILRR